jgi:hypothetical protein
MILPAFFKGPDILVAQRTPIRMGCWLLCSALCLSYMSIEKVSVKTFLAGTATFKLILFCTFFEEMGIQCGYFNYLTTARAICKHQALIQKMVI